MRKIFLAAAVVAVSLSSCSINEVTEVLESSDNINKIGMSVAAGVTRGIETTTATVETSNELVLSYFGKDAKTENEVSGNLTMAYNEDKDAWDQTATDKKLWSSLALPASFYSMHAGNESMTAKSLTKESANFAAYTPEADIAIQKDLVCYAGSIAAMPAAGYIRGNFNHALSRIEIYSNQGEYIPYVKSVDFMNLKNSGKANLTVGGVCSWGVDEAQAVAYSYLDLLSTDAFEMDNEKLITNVVGHNKDDKNNMIIIPQLLVDAKTTITELNGDKDPVVQTEENYKTEAENVKMNSAFSGIAGSYIKVLYRMDDATDTPVAGYYAAKESNAYQTMVEADKLILPTTIGDDSPLYVLVGFPFTDGQSFAVGKDYDINLGFGVNGGYLLYDYYFDKEGNPTNIKVDGLDTNDPIIDPDAPIGIMVTVTDWVSGGSVTVE